MIRLILSRYINDSRDLDLAVKEIQIFSNQHSLRCLESVYYDNHIRIPITDLRVKNSNKRRLLKNKIKELENSI